MLHKFDFENLQSIKTNKIKTQSFSIINLNDI
jgi:hypothetical protein